MENMLKFNPLFNSKAISIIVFSMIIAILVDTSITKIYLINFNQAFSLEPKIQAFFSIGILCFANQFIYLKYLKRKTAQQHIIKQQISLIYTVTYFSQIVFFAIFIIIFFEMYLNERYHSISLVLLASGISGLAALITVILGKTFLKWFMTEKNVVLVLYALSFYSLSLSIIFSGCMTIAYLSNKPDIIYFHYAHVIVSFNPNVIDILNIGYYISSICGFTLLWISTILMLNQYSIRWKSRMHWIIVSLPMAYFLIQFNPILLEGILNLTRLSPIPYHVFYTLFVGYSQPVGGIIFGGAFWALTKVLAKKNIHFEFPQIAGYGFILLFMSNQIVLISPANYPPFSIVSISMIPLSCCMIFVGIYYSALTISFDRKLKTAIKGIVNKRSNLLLSMSSSEAIHFLEKRLNDIRNQISKESPYDGADTMLSIEEAKDYINEELEYIRKTEKDKKLDNNF